MTTDTFAAVGTTSSGGPSLRQRLRSPESALGLAGAVLLPLGLLTILLGWYGASHTPYLFEQVPYLISGGLIGLAFVVAGGLAYFASWIARSAAAQQRTGEELAGMLREIRDELARRPVASAPAASTTTASQRKAMANGNGHAFVATSGGSMLHRPGCSVVAGREGLRPVSTSSGLKPCGMCDPLSTTV